MVWIFPSRPKSRTWALEGFRRKNFWRPLTVLCARRLAGYLLIDHLLIGYLVINYVLMVLTDQQLMNVQLIVGGSSWRSTSNFPPNKFNVDARIGDRVTNRLIRILASTFGAVCGESIQKANLLSLSRAEYYHAQIATSSLLFVNKNAEQVSLNSMLKLLVIRL